MPPNRYRLVSMVSHLGRSTTSGHYVSDAYSIAHQRWLAFNDNEVVDTEEKAVLEQGERTGYLLFYMHSDAAEEVSQSRGTDQAHGRGDQARCVLTPP
ncbi:ubiquitin carboxyl-terminal hydrolase 37-like [Amia ocellicauda]|uniref:ubiquitin carboxyl-terminal hydrolase 37-like n=1 Tax=Amia ocellicauda TaxID=2972642 RepID=UPI003464A41E